MFLSVDIKKLVLIAALWECPLHQSRPLQIVLRFLQFLTTTWSSLCRTMQTTRCPHDSIDISFEHHPDENLRPRNPPAENTLPVNGVSRFSWLSEIRTLLSLKARDTFESDEEEPEHELLGGPSKYTIPEDGDPWETCYQKVKEYDDELVKGWRDQVDKLLIFVRLFKSGSIQTHIDQNVGWSPRCNCHILCHWVLEEFARRPCWQDQLDLRAIAAWGS